MVTLRSKSAPRKSKRLETASKKVEKEQITKKVNNGKLSKKSRGREKTTEEIKEEYVTPPPSRAPSPQRSPIYIPHDGPVILDVVVSRRNKRQPSYKPKNNDWIKKSSKIEFVGPERRLFRASVQRRGHKKQREYILVDYLYKNSYKTKLPPKNLWLDEPDYEFFPMQNVKGDNNNEVQPKGKKESTAKKAKSTAKKPPESEKTKKAAAPRAKSANRTGKQTKEKTSKPQQVKQRSKSVPKVASTPKKKTSPSEMKTPSRKPRKPRSEERPTKKALARRESSSPKLPVPYSIFPSPPSESRSTSHTMSLPPPPIHVPEDPVHILTSTPNTNVGKPKAFRPWPMRVRKPILAGSASPRSTHSADPTSLDLLVRNRRLSGVSHPGQSDIDEEEDFDNEVTMLSPRRERIYSQQTPVRPSHFSERRLSSHSQPAPQLGRVLSMPPPASSGSRSPSISVSSLGSGTPRRVPNKRWDAIYAHRSPQKKLHHSFSQPAILPSSTRSLHGDFMSQTASSQPQETSTNIHRSANSSRVSFSESRLRTPVSKRRSLNPDITLEDEEEMNEEADSIQLKARTPKSRPGRIPTSDAIWDDEISKIKF
ncbi:Oidioi.mRNA.OKI2018_I69.chr2.g5728.t1.cds [Oikopleura dioica]|uniref:Oidioi.mRNA.OKI2018_I69.chr2.g5728.t1.cds n=1 Tax=Oikopleura dioica TaxID=34765 RepID=A0ABN7T1C0_OIKDI|nr:Oidioi.mRNA.OKI2018_I69.chr2.g5728.t1.cds [Oikopleura dioica]